MADIVFLDASVLLSAAYRSGAKISRLWQRDDVRLTTSSYAVEEARRNLDTTEQRDRLTELLHRVAITQAIPRDPLPGWIILPDKDVPILQAAIAAGATHLLTSDIKHFGRCYWQIVEGVRKIPPAAYGAQNQI